MLAAYGLARQAPQITAYFPHSEPHLCELTLKIEILREESSDQRQPTTGPFADDTNDAMPQATKSNKPTAGKQGQGRSAIEDVVAREYTIHLHKHVRSV